MPHAPPDLLLARLAVVAAGIAMIGFAGLAWLRPERARRFLSAFASSVQTHVVEQLLRLLFGAALVRLSSYMWQGPAFRLLGWATAISAVVLLILPWTVHRRFAGRVLPGVVKHLRLFGVAVGGFGGVLLVAVSIG